MFNFRKKAPVRDSLKIALTQPVPQSVRLFSELVENGETRQRPLLMTSPLGDHQAAVAAGDLAAAALDMGFGNVRLMDLRKLIDDPEKEEDTLARKLATFRPAAGLMANAEKFRDWMRELTASPSLAIVLCGGVLDPRHWTEDPAAWATLNPRVILAVGEGIHSETQVEEAAARLRRRGMDIAGGILVRREQGFLASTITSIGTDSNGPPSDFKTREAVG